jgi:hypothetical protein
MPSAISSGCSADAGQRASDKYCGSVHIVFRFCFVLMSRAYRRKRKSSRGLLLILSDFCASYTASPQPGLFIRMLHCSYKFHPMAGLPSGLTQCLA